MLTSGSVWLLAQLNCFLSVYTFILLLVFFASVHIFFYINYMEAYLHTYISKIMIHVLTFCFIAS